MSIFNHGTEYIPLSLAWHLTFCLLVEGIAAAPSASPHEIFKLQESNRHRAHNTE